VCLVIDTCCLVKVFDPKNKEHYNFVPVWEWIHLGRGRMIYGGTKYLTELRQVTRILGLIGELSRKGRVKVLSRSAVDTIAQEIKAQVSHSEFNDEHLVAIVIVSRCHVVCTDDRKAMPYLKRKELYKDHGMKRPKIYQRRKTHERLCCDENVIVI